MVGCISWCLHLVHYGTLVMFVSYVFIMQEGHKHMILNSISSSLVFILVYVFFFFGVARMIL